MGPYSSPPWYLYLGAKTCPGHFPVFSLLSFLWLGLKLRQGVSRLFSCFPS